jgi:hypothetical protein
LEVATDPAAYVRALAESRTRTHYPPKNPEIVAKSRVAACPPSDSGSRNQRRTHQFAINQERETLWHGKVLTDDKETKKALDGGSLDESWRQQPGTPSYCHDLDAEAMNALADSRPERLAQYREETLARAKPWFAARARQRPAIERDCLS